MSSVSENQSLGNLTVGYDRKEQMRCMLCGGKDCSKCGLDAYKKISAPAIAYLHSHWITEKIVGMQRPNETSLNNGALDDMVKQKFTAVFNLTEPGEHPFCGCGNMSDSGFPYHPETLMKRGIKHFNFNWRDMTVPTLDMMDRIVAIACNEIQNGGKIAIHCHAGFGRTGLAIACILIANDHLPADSVITFVRNRRPGSIQTAAQQQFIFKYEKHQHLMMQVFPTYEEVEEKRTGSTKTKSFVAYPKTIAVSVEDQRHFFSHLDQAKQEFRYVHKIVYLTSRAISRLSFDQFNVACLALTGLNKLTVKRNSIDGGRDSDAYAARAESLTTRPQLLRKKSSFMVATNSLSESSEENMLVEIKLELNQNNFVRTVSLADVISADFRARGESLSRLEAKVSQHLIDVGQSFRSGSKRSLHNSSSQRGLGTRENSQALLRKDPSRRDHRVSTPPQHHLTSLSHPHAHSESDVVHRAPNHNSQVEHHHHLHPVGHRPIGEQGLETAETNHFNHRKSKDNLMYHGLAEDNSHRKQHGEIHGDEHLSIVSDNSSPARLSEIRELHASTDDAEIDNLSSSKMKLSVQISSGNTTDNDASIAVSRPQSSNKEREDQLSGIISQKEQSISPAVPKISLPSPKAIFRGLSARSINNDNSQQSNASGNNTQRSNASAASVVSPMTAVRANSLRMNTEQDYAKSKKMAANLIAQLLLDWLETRSDSIFTEEDVDKLQDIWAQYGGIPKVTEDRMDDDGASSRSLSDKGASAVAATATASAVPVASSPGEIQDDFYEDELIEGVYALLVQRMSRYKLELLSCLVEMYRFIRLAGFEYTVKLQAKAQEAALNSPNETTGGPNSSDSLGSAGSETQALDALVGLRLAIACMHARKKNSNLVRRRGLIIDLVKVFLLKSSSSEYVIINNITFSAENFAQIQHNIGIVLLGQIDVIFRTLNLLVDTQWSSSYKKVRGKHRGHVIDANRVGWRDISIVQEFRSEVPDSDCT